MQTENDDDLDGGQRSSEVKWGKLCAMGVKPYNMGNKMQVGMLGSKGI